MTKGDLMIKRLRERKLSQPIEQRMTEAEARAAHPDLQDAWEKYQILLRLHGK